MGVACLLAQNSPQRLVSGAIIAAMDIISKQTITKSMVLLSASCVTSLETHNNSCGDVSNDRVGAFRICVQPQLQSLLGITEEGMISKQEQYCTNAKPKS